MSCISCSSLGARFLRARANTTSRGSRSCLAMARDDLCAGAIRCSSEPNVSMSDALRSEEDSGSDNVVKSQDLKHPDAEKKLRKILSDAGVSSFDFKRVPSDYYERSLEGRQELLGAASVDHLCKSMIMVNTQAQAHVTDCSDRKNSKYYMIVVQYTARLHAEKVKKFIYDLNEGKIPKKRFNLRLAPEEESERLSGFQHNAVTPIGMQTDIPVIMSDAIAKLKPEFFWLGGGEVDLKLGINTQDFIGFVKPFVIDCTYSEM